VTHSTGVRQADTVELGVQLLERLEHAELSVADALDRVEAVTGEPAVQREILEVAERRGVIERDGATVRPSSAAYVDFDAEVVTKEGEFDCERCGAGLSTGHFIRLEDGDVGPYGSTCIRKVTGRD
jgi:hypothetical protein